MTELKPQSETTEVFPAPTSTPFAVEGEPEADLEDHIIDLHGAVSALFHLPNFDNAAGIYLIARIRDHAESIRRAFYRHPQPCGE